MRAAVLFVLLAMPVGASALAQQTVVDQGSFTLYLNNERVGREQFSIKRNQTTNGVSLLSQGTVTFADRRLGPTLTTDTAGRPTAYDLRVYAGTKLITNVQAVVRASRLTGVMSDGAGKTTERDIPLNGNAVVADDEIVHHLYFVARFVGGRVTVIAPRRLARDTVHVVLRATGAVEIGNGTLPSRHLTVTAAGGTVTDLWVDDSGRVLRVSVPSRGFTAVRDEAPR